jgi:hypothetical protein
MSQPWIFAPSVEFTQISSDGLTVRPFHHSEASVVSCFFSPPITTQISLGVTSVGACSTKRSSSITLKLEMISPEVTSWNWSGASMSTHRRSREPWLEAVK